MTIFYSTKGQEIDTRKSIGLGSEGEVFETNLDDYVAKIYEKPDEARRRKLEVMIAHPPNSIMLSEHVAIAWPTDLLLDSNNKFKGFLMPRVKESIGLIKVISPQFRQETKFNWKYLHATAKNISWIVNNLHQKEYILGDIKPQNILVNNRANVSIVDADSFQVVDPRTQKVYRCPVGSDDQSPPELLEQTLADINQVKAHDRFRLAIIIHQILFGYNPFSLGKWIGSGQQPATIECIRLGYWPYGNDSLISPNDLTISLEVVHPKLKELFLKCFNDGHMRSELRPTAQEWQGALDLAIEKLESCSKVSSHVYYGGYGTCYWCERRNLLNFDTFESYSQHKVNSPVVNNSSIPKPVTKPAISTVKPSTQPSTQGCGVMVCDRISCCVFDYLLIDVQL
jgi:DNA-binding helix-hairpin-helix protein with protein kinase domain